MFLEAKLSSKEAEFVGNLDTTPRSDLRKKAYDFQPNEKAEYSFQQYEGTDYFQWYCRSGVYWRPCGPILRLRTTSEAQDEGAAGEASAYRVRMISDDPAEWVLMHSEKALDFLSRKGWESQPLYAHPSPTPTRASAQNEGAAGEPVAWSFELAGSINTETREYLDWDEPRVTFSKPCVPEGSIRNLTPLYAHPSPTPAADADRVRADRYYEALVQADLKIRSLPGTDQSDVEFIRAALKSTAAKEGGKS